MVKNTTKLADIAAQFALEAKAQEVRPFGNGLINDSYFVETPHGAPDYVLQHINHAIFKNVDMLQNNIDAVTTHIRKKLLAKGTTDIERKVLRFVPANDGKKYYHDGESYWRMMYYIPRSVSYEQVNAQYAGYAGRAFGEFQSMLADMPEKLGEVIPDFHNMEFRIFQFKEACQSNAAKRLDANRIMMWELEKRIVAMCRAERLHREGLLPKRVCHCDTKVNNMLFDKDSGEILCVIDLDTVMPSFIFSDYGDFLRTAANTSAEDEPNAEKIDFNMDIFCAFTKEYVAAAKGFLTKEEINGLPYAAALFPYMQCVRFFTDYINGDTYYKIQYPEHNLVRAQAQFNLLLRAEEKQEEMQKYIETIL
jgi:hypothetical protein